MSFKIIPAIDLVDGKCVRLQQGDYNRKTIYNENPLEVAKQFENSGIKYLHLVDLDGAKSGKVINWEVIEALTSKTQLSIDFGGGVKTIEELERLLEIGVSKVNLGSLALKSPKLVASWITEFPETIILSADVKNELIAIGGWKEETNTSIYSLIDQYMKFGLREVVCTDITQDGMLQGPSTDLYLKLLQQFPELQLIASGGVSKIEDVQLLQENQLAGVIIGKAIYENRITLKQLESYAS